MIPDVTTFVPFQSHTGRAASSLFNSSSFAYANDSVTLYIPEVDVYPDMVKEKWTLSKVQDFAKENNLTLDITYKETTDVEENIVLSQGRDPGDPIYNGYTLKITISKKPEDKTEPTDSLMPKDDKKDKKTE